ncbi:FAD-binding and (Fe-S)-binding domain-containing protein [Sphaerisporangium perillae]|uniref:FAD-binding and (Fe-S)-binding domain-containing protein n=1 Tax=Sphaerisporangium perillae TaxID=2935860 RepID=UPI00200E4A59|nr:FAD-binding and (Fe-S)-binding domain-containing protein [Sphaerisporangium perillae]
MRQTRRDDAVPTSSRSMDRLAMAHDASHYLLVPESVATPRRAEDLARLFRDSRTRGVPLTFRSGGTSLSGQGVTSGVLADTRRNFQRIDVLDDGARVRVEPGVTMRQVNTRLTRYGRKLGPDPASEVACTVGGVVANNSSGMACGTEHNTYRTLDSLVIVLPSGTIVDTAAPDADDRLRHVEPELWHGLTRLRDRVRGNPESVRTIRRQFAMKNTMGYGVNSFLDFDRPVDILAHLIVGSEGTLAFIAEATFRTVPALPAAATGLAIFPSLSAATAALPEMVGAGLATIELMDATSLTVAQGSERSTPELSALQVDGHAAFLIEYLGETAEDVARLRAAGAELLGSLEVVSPVSLTQDARERAALWSIRKGLYTSVAGARPSGTTALLEDVVVPVPLLLGTCESLLELFERHRYEQSVIFGHAKDGNVHFLLNERFEDPAGLDRYQRFTEDMVDVVLGNGGSLKAEHGTGRIMAPFVRRQYGDELYEVMREIKRLCDPDGILNPGAVLSDDPASYVRDLKSVPTVEPEVDRCVECGYCEPSCPSKNVTLTPRQRIVLRREMRSAEATGDEALLAELRADYAYEGVDTCAADGMCQVACPVQINTGDLVRRLRAENAGAVEQSMGNVAAKHWGAVARAAGVALSAADVLPSPAVTAVTRLGRAALGADTVPLYDERLPRGGARRRPLVAEEPEAVYFPACIGTIFGAAGGGAGVSSAFLALCERAGVAVTVPDGIASFCCGTPWKSKGLTRGYDRMTRIVLPALWEASRGGALPIVCDAASCTEGLDTMRQAAGRAGGDHASLRFVDAIEFVHGRVLPGLTVTAPLSSIAVHHTCSSTQLGTNAMMTAIAEHIAGEVLVPLDWGCCGFAGDRGLLHPELTASATEREAAEVKAGEFQAYASANRTCELGMSMATGRDYQHLLELLERATRPVV